MADPITGIGAVLTIKDTIVAASKIIQYCYGYVQKYRNAASEVEQVARVLRALVSILTEVNNLVTGRRKGLDYLPHTRPTNRYLEGGRTEHSPKLTGGRNEDETTASMAVQTGRYNSTCRHSFIQVT